MKIKNEYVNINIGKNKFSFKNMILDKYLERLAKSQIKGIGVGYAPVLNACYLKYNDKLIFDEESELHIRHFNKKCTGEIINQTYNDGTISTTYKYNTSSLDLGKEITAIGFFEDDIDECLACINTYGLGLTINDITNFYIERKDTISVDATFTNINPGVSSSNIDKILHLIPEGTNYNVFLENVYFGDRVSATVEASNIDIVESSLEKGKIEFASTFHNEYKNGLLVPGTSCPGASTIPLNLDQQYTYIWLQYCPYDNVTKVNTPYYLKMPIKILSDYKFSINFERSDN